MAVKIKNIFELRNRAEGEDGCECYILLNGGARSSKRVRYFPEAQEAENEIWGTDDDQETDVFDENDYVEMGKAREDLLIHWEVLHEIDDTFAEYTSDKALERHTHIVEALEKGVLFAYE